jgi:hypothetical protein
MVAISLMMTSCEKFSEKTFAASFNTTFEVNITDEAGATVIDLERLLSATKNDDIEKYRDDIKSYELVNIRYKIWEYSGDPAATMTGTLGVGNALSATPGVSFSLNDISLQAINDDPEYRQIEKTQQDIDKIQQYLLDTDGLRFYLDGSVTHQPMSFKLDIWVDIKALAEVKD